MRATCVHCAAKGGLGRSIVHKLDCPMYVAPGPDAPARVPFDRPVVPTCPELCCFRTTCATSTQEGIAELFADGTLKRREQCVMYARRASVHRETTGCEPPASSAELLEQMATVRERAAIAEEGQ